MGMIEDLVYLGVEATPNKFYGQDGKEHDRTSTISASELGSCIRQLAYKKHGYDGPLAKRTWGAAERGNSGEAWVVEKIQLGLEAEGKGGVLLYAGKDQVTLEDQGISGTPDGLILYPDGTSYGVEIKTADPMLKLDDPKEKHVMQSELQIELWHRCTEYRPQEVLLTYFVASDYQRIHEFIIGKSEEIWVQAQARRDQLFSETNPENFLAEGAFVGDCDYCSFREGCRGSRLKKLPTSISEPLPSTIAEKLEPLAAERVVLKRQLKEEEAAVKRIDEMIKDLMSEAGTKRGQAGDFRISIALVQGRTMFDFDAMRADGIDLDDYEYKGSPHSRLTVSKPKR